VVKALVDATGFLQADLAKWQVVSDGSTATTEKQQQLLNRLQAVSFDLAKIPEMKGWASHDANELNKILVENGFDIRLTPWPNDPYTFGVVAILDITVEWQQSGKKIDIYTKWEDKQSQQKFPGFKLDADANDIQCLSVPGTDRPVVKIYTKSGDVVCLHVTGLEPNLYGLYDLVQDLQTQAKPNDIYDGLKTVTIPMIKLRQQVDISWLQGLNLKDYYIAQAMQEVRFVMNEHGAHAKTATAVSMRNFCALPGGITNVVIDDDFLFWIERPGVATPVFVGYFTKADWKDPGSLDNI